MKAFVVILFAVLVSNAHAWTSTKCSSSDGSALWQVGVDNDYISLKYSNFVEGFLTLEIEQVNIEMTKEVILREKTFRTEQTVGSVRVYAGSVKITASEKHPDVLRSQFPENKVVTEVICTTTVANAISRK